MAEISLIRGHHGGVLPQTALITTKFSIPLTPPAQVARPHLTQCITDGLHKKLTILCASVGFGKTSLLAEWGAWQARQSDHPRPIAWVSLEASENDPGRFWRYVLTALGRVAPQIGEEALTWLQSPEPPPMEVILTSVINTLAAGTGQVVLVLDDYHVIEADPIHQALTFLLEHLPSQLHLMLASRSHPPLPLARWRSRGQVNELYTADLRFTVEEAAAFLHRATGQPLPLEAVATLEQRTEGWIAGLQLAALSLKGHGESAQFIRAFGGSHRFVLDYLSEEVLRQQPEVVQTFLLQTAILDRLSAPLCEAVTGQQSSQALLEYLEQANLFVVPLDDERTWYRYHHLFSELLRHRLRRSSPEQVPDLHRRAADWYEQQGLLAEAVSHALTAVDYARAVRLIEQAAPSMLQQERSTLKQWIEALPTEQLKRSPRLCIAYAALLLASLHFEEVEPYLQQAEAALQETLQAEMLVQVQQMLAEIDSLRADLARHRGEFPSAITLCRQALERVPKEQVLLRGSILLTLGGSYINNCELEAAQHFLTEALELSQEASDIYGVLNALYLLADTQTTLGQLRQSCRTYQRALHLVESHPQYRGARHVGLSHIFLGDILREWNQLDVAAQTISRGIEHGEQYGVDVVIPLGKLMLARVRQAQGVVDEAAALIEYVEQLLHHSGKVFVFTVASLYLVRHWLAQGKLTAAMQWAQGSQARLECDDSPCYIYTFERSTLVRVLLAQSRQERHLTHLPTAQPLEEALSLIELVRARAKADGQMTQMLEALVLQALVQQALSHPLQALSALQEALTLAEPEGYVRLFVDEGAPMAKLLQQVLAAGWASPYAMTLLEALGVPPSQQQGTSLPQVRSHQELMEPLSEREVEVLHLLATGGSNAELAQALLVSMSTVRTHLRHIYDKLGVTNRTQAVTRARELHLLVS